ncbi:MAG: molybdopterin-dependent oxidoreductase [Coriobacteriia bacterium]
MSKIRHRRWLAYSVAVAVVVVLVAVTGCVGQARNSAIGTNSQTASTPTTDTPTGQPKVTTLKDGRKIQLTPNYKNSKDYTDMTYVPGISDVSYNLDVLKSDERGCGSCHKDLWDTMKALDPAHLGASKHLQVMSDVQQCLECHSKDNGGWTPALSSMIHGLHNVGATGTAKAQCFNCHDTDSSTGQMVLWDQVKHERLQGITSVRNVTGDFTYSQDTTVSDDELFNINWMYTNQDQIRWEGFTKNKAQDEATFDNWEISITGEVNKTVTWKLGDLVKTAPVETALMKMHCEINPLGGPFIGQVEVKGIPLDWLFQQAGLKSSAAAMTFLTPDGVVPHNVFQDIKLSELQGHKALLVYEINGERLSWASGYPCQIWLGSIPASRYAKQVSQIIIKDSADSEPIAGYLGRFGSGPANIGLTNTLEGQIVEAGKPYTFEGYADGWTMQVAGVEFSMDGGSTWSRYDTPNTDSDRWVCWRFSWTPKAGTDTAYVLKMRTVLADGTVSGTPLEVMVNAQAKN